MNVKILTPTGESGEVTLDDAIFGAKVNVPLMHQIVTAQLAAARSGTHSTKTRGEVRGGGAKPWRQKGTGRARHGSSREPQWKGGGVAWGPHPRDHSQSVPKKMKAQALRSALSARAAEGKVVVVDGLVSEKPRTKDAIAALKSWGVEGKILLVLTVSDALVAYSFRNLPHVHLIADHQLNVYDIMNADAVIFARGALDSVQARLSKTTGGAPSATPSDTGKTTGGAPSATPSDTEKTTGGAPSATPSDTDTTKEGGETS